MSINQRARSTEKCVCHLIRLQKNLKLYLKLFLKCNCKLVIYSDSLDSDTNKKFMISRRQKCSHKDQECKSKWYYDDSPSSLICREAPYGVIPAWLAPLLVPYWSPIMDCPAFNVSSSKFRLFSLATLTPRAGPSQDFFWAWEIAIIQRVFL